MISVHYSLSDNIPSANYPPYESHDKNSNGNFPLVSLQQPFVVWYFLNANFDKNKDDLVHEFRNVALKK